MRSHHRRLDERPEVGYQVGVTLENTEKPKCKSDAACLNTIKQLDPSERPLDVEGIGICDLVSVLIIDYLHFSNTRTLCGPQMPFFLENATEASVRIPISSVEHAKCDAQTFCGDMGG